METIRFDGVLTALTSITHNGGESYGTEAKLRRENYIQPDYSVEAVPVLSGNSIRGRLRDVGMAHMCGLLGYGDGETGLIVTAFHFLFSGGSLTSTGGKSISIAEARKLKALIPLVGVLGGSMGNQIMPGVLKCGKAVPICRETRHLLPAAYAAVETSCWDLTQREMYTRKDDIKDDRKRKYLSGATTKLLDQADEVKQKKPAKEPVEKNDGSTAQMMYTVETLAAGTKLFWRVVLDDPNAMEMEAFMVCLAQFAKMPYVGGKSNVGHGEVSIDMGTWFKVDPNHVTGAEVAMPMGTGYVAHIKEHAADIRSQLERIV
jgi:CRISPR type IV-associated protein Csf2